MSINNGLYQAVAREPYQRAKPNLYDKLHDIKKLISYDMEHAMWSKLRLFSSGIMVNGIENILDKHWWTMKKITTQKELRNVFWKEHREYIRQPGWTQNQYPATIRTAWVMFVDWMAHNKYIDEKLAKRAIL